MTTDAGPQFNRGNFNQTATTNSQLIDMTRQIVQHEQRNMSNTMGKTGGDIATFPANAQPPGSSTPTLEHSQISDPMQIAKAHAKNMSFI